MDIFSFHTPLLCFCIASAQAIRAEGKEMVLALGLTKMSAAEMYVACLFVFFSLYLYSLLYRGEAPFFQIALSFQSPL